MGALVLFTRTAKSCQRTGADVTIVAQSARNGQLTVLAAIIDDTATVRARGRTTGTAATVIVIANRDGRRWGYGCVGRTLGRKRSLTGFFFSLNAGRL
jgi:hypothetical protein